MRGTNVVLVCQDVITFNARIKLQDSTAMEYFAVNETVRALQPLICRVHPDIVHVQDSSSSVAIISKCKPHGVFERLLSQMRCQLLRSLPRDVQFAARHVTREFIPDCDYLSKYPVFTDTGEPTRFFAGFELLLHSRLQFAPKILFIPPPDGARQRMTILIRAKDHPKELPSFDSMAFAYD